MKAFVHLIILATAVLAVNGQPQSVGYINVSLQPGLNLVGIQLDTSDKRVAAFFPEMPEGTEIYRVENGQFTSNSFQGGEWDRPDDILNVGEGLGVLIPPSQPKLITFTGTILQGDLMNAIPAGLSIRCSIVPKGGKLSQDLGLRPSSFDNVYVLTNGSLHVFTFLPDGTWNPSEPKLDSADAFLINASKPLDWAVHFELPILFPPASPAGSFSAASLRPLAGAPLGTVNFSNGAALVDAPVTFQNDGAGVQGPEWQVELLHQSGPDFVTVAGPAPFATASLAGYFFLGSISVPGTQPGDMATFKVRVQNSSAAFATESAPVTVTLGGGIFPPANLAGLQPIQVPPPIRLSVSLAGEQLNVSWPKEIPNASLQMTTDFPPNWRTVGVTTVTNANSISAPIEISAARQFFRLVSF